MKSTLLLLLLGLAICLCCVHAQVPQGIAYQAAARNDGQLMHNSFIQVRFGIERLGNIIYEEEHNVQTNAFGLFRATIGKGTPTIGTFTSIDWAAGEHFLQVDFNIGNGYQNMGRSQLISVPYSLLAKKAESADLTVDELSDVSSPSPNQGDILKWDGTQWVQSMDAVMDADSDPANELQSLSLVGEALTLSQGGGTVSLPTGQSYQAGPGIAIDAVNNIISNIEPDQPVSITGSGPITVTGSYPNFDIGTSVSTIGTLADIQSVSGFGNDPNDSMNTFLSPVVTVTLANNVQKVMVMSHKSFGSQDSAGGSDLNLWIGFRPSGSTGPPFIWGPGTFGQQVPSNMRVLMGLSAVLTGLGPGSFDVGLIGTGKNWDWNEWGTTTVMVFN
ncbi:MAG: hypothetical protein AAF587_13390 [Bacteroidota bacterium]